jgi:hypothetical protein
MTIEAEKCAGATNAALHAALGHSSLRTLRALTINVYLGYGTHADLDIIGWQTISDLMHGLAPGYFAVADAETGMGLNAGGHFATGPFQVDLETVNVVLIAYSSQHVVNLGTVLEAAERGVRRAKMQRLMDGAPMRRRTAALKVGVVQGTGERVWISEFGAETKALLDGNGRTVGPTES